MHSLWVSNKVVTLNELNYSRAEISEITGLPKSTVQYILAKYNKTDKLSVLGGSGRKRALSDREEKYILEKVSQCPRLTAVELSKDLAAYSGSCVTPQTIRNYLRLFGLQSRSACRKPLVSMKNKKLRFDLCKKWSYLPNVAL